MEERTMKIEDLPLMPVEVPPKCARLGCRHPRSLRNLFCDACLVTVTDLTKVSCDNLPAISNLSN